MLNQLLSRLTSASPRLKRLLWKQAYELLAKRYQKADWTFMNYGYAPVDPGAATAHLKAEDEPDRYSIQLYHHLISAVEMRGARVLEVGCGRGGGSSYIARYLQPASVLGIDFSAEAIALCNRIHSVPNLSFQQGDAEALPCGDGAFDVVVNVESSHCYGSPATFFREAARVLKPGGYFLWTDMLATDRVAETRRGQEAAGFTFVREEVVTPNILHALDLVNDRKRNEIRTQIPRWLSGAFADFAGVRGTRVYESLRAGSVQYLGCVLRKPG